MSMQKVYHRTSRAFRSMITPTATTFHIELLDGGTGEELMRRGLPDDRKTWSALALTDSQYHNLLIDVHASYLRAGSDMITCNNYGITPGVGFSDPDISRFARLSAEVAQQARDQANKPNARILASLPPLLESYRPDIIPDHKRGVSLYKMISESMLPLVDGYLAETLSSIAEAEMVFEAVSTLPKPLLVSFTLQRDGKIRSGESATQAVNTSIESTKDGGLYAVCFNCSEPEAISVALQELRDNNMIEMLASKGIKLGAYANRLTEIQTDWALADAADAQPMRTDLSIQVYTKYALEWMELGATIIGGCCGIGPEYIADIYCTLQEKQT